MKTYLAVSALLLSAGTLAAQSLPSASDNGAYNLHLIVAVAEAPDEGQPLPDNGVYMTATDYEYGRLMDAFANGTPKEQIWADAGSIKVRTPQVTEAFHDAHTWGFRKADTDYRVVDNNVYEVVSDRDIMMYRLVTVNLNDPIQPSLFYFSRTPETDLYPINKTNLEMVYSDHPAFINKLKEVDTTTRDNTDPNTIKGGQALYLFRQSMGL